MRPGSPSGLTAYVLDVKVFVGLIPSSGDRYASAFLRASSPRLFVCHSCLTPEIGKPEELRELELPRVGSRFGETFGESRSRESDEGCISRSGSARGHRRRVLFCNPHRRRQSQRSQACRPRRVCFEGAAAVLRAESGSERCSGQVPRPGRRIRSVSDRQRDSTAIAIFRPELSRSIQFSDSHATRRGERFGSRFRRFAAAWKEQLLHRGRFFQVAS